MSPSHFLVYKNNVSLLYTDTHGVTYFAISAFFRLSCRFSPGTVLTPVSTVPVEVQYLQYLLILEWCTRKYTLIGSLAPNLSSITPDPYF